MEAAIFLSYRTKITVLFSEENLVLNVDWFRPAIVGGYNLHCTFHGALRPCRTEHPGLLLCLCQGLIIR